MKRTTGWIGNLLCLVAGAALWLSFSTDLLFPLAWFGLVPYLAFLWGRPGWGGLMLGHALMTAVYLGGILYWIPRVLRVYGGLSGPVTAAAFLLMLLLLALCLLPFTLLVRWLVERGETLALLAAPGAWVLTELIRNFWLVNGFPWALLGYSQYPYSWITQIADIGGVYLVSFLVLSVNVSLWAAFHRRSWSPLLPALILFGGSNLYGAYRFHGWEPQNQGPVKVALVQPNLMLFQPREYYAAQYFDVLPREYGKASGGGADWVIFPEAPNPYFYGEDFYFTSFWQRQVGLVGTPLLFNATTREAGTSEGYHNSAILLGQEETSDYLYHKTHLVPFGEYIPLAGLFGVLFEPLVQEVASFSPGSDLMVGRIGGIRFGPLICYEGIFPEISRRLAAGGAEVLVNITNDTWYGRSAAAAQHLRIATFRAIETRKPLLRAANSGYSAIIDPRGRIVRQLGLFEQGVLLEEVAGNRHLSFYSRVGEWITMGIVGMTGLLVLAGGRRRGPIKKGRVESWKNTRSTTRT